MRDWRLRVGVVASVLGGGLGLAVPGALGCSCAGRVDAREDLQHTEGAVIGTVRATRSAPDSESTVVLTVGVERGFNATQGPELEIRTNANGGTCGLGMLPVGSDLSQLVHRTPTGEWETSICEHVAPEALRRGARSLPPVRRGRAAVVLGGAFGPLRSIALDADGRPVGYGRADGTVLEAVVCPGGRRVVEAVAGEGARSPSMLAVRRLPGLALVRSARLPLRRSEFPSGLSCGDPGARTVRLFVPALTGNGSRGRVLEWNGVSFETARRVGASRGVLAGSRFYGVEGRGRQRLVSIAVHSGHLTRVATLPGEVTRVAGDASGRFAAVVSLPLRRSRPRKRLVAFDPHAGGPLHVISVPGGPDAASLLWSGRGRLVLLTYDGHVRVFDSSLRRIGTISGVRYMDGPFVVRGETLYGIERGELMRAHLPGGRARPVRELPVTEVAALAGTSSSIASPPRDARAATCASWTRVRRVVL